MDDSNVPFADTTAKRAQLMAATEQYRTSINQSVETLKGNAEETGKTIAFVAGVALGVFLLANTLLPKSEEYRHAEKYGEPGAHNNDHLRRSAAKQAARTQQSNKAQGPSMLGLLGGVLTPILTNLARQQFAQYMARLSKNDATQSKPAADSFQPFN